MNTPLSKDEYTYVLTWRANSDNQNIKKYRIYILEGKRKRLLVELNEDIYEYRHIKVKKDKKYIYAICGINDVDIEGEFAYVEVK